jgi:shikimate kinase
MSIVLIGFMGSGKSRVGRILARLLACPFVDLDARIEEAAGRSIPEVFRERGEDAFRSLETAQLSRSLSEGSVLSTGGGVVTREENRALLRESKSEVVWLQASPQVLAERIRSEPGARPLIDGDGLLDLAATVERVRVLLEARAPLYEDCASISIQTDGAEPEAIARHIVERLNAARA